MHNIMKPASSRKWLKTPHNRFKLLFLLAQISIFLALKVDSLANSTDEFTEVDLSAERRSSGARRASRLYRVTGLQLNGRLVGPARRLEAASETPADCTRGQQAELAALSPTLRLVATKEARAEVEPQQSGREQDALLGAPSDSAKQAESIFSLIDEYDSRIATKRTQAHLSCDSGEMILRLNFSEPFKGIVYPDHNRLSPCRFFGDGHHNYELRLPLRGCGTRQAGPRVFVNDVIVRFHKTLELEEDEVKTLICRYPPPLAAGSGSSPELELSTSNKARPTAEELPFELVDARPEPGTSGQIETLSENLLVAPVGVQQPKLWPNANASGQLLDPSAVDSFGSRSSSGTGPRPATGAGRASSFEVLLLISSLMFLALLALGLLSGLYCLQRRRRKRRRLRRLRGHHQQASAMLARKPAFGPPGVGVGGAPTGPKLAQPLYLGHLQQLAAASSSPDSDLSGRTLLRAASGPSPAVRSLSRRPLGPQRPTGVLGRRQLGLQTHQSQAHSQQALWRAESLGSLAAPAGGERLWQQATLAAKLVAPPPGGAPGRRPEQAPSRLLLHRIEDSYITKLTEVHEQEFKARDSRRPLPLEEWRRLRYAKPAASTAGSGSGGGSDRQCRQSAGHTGSDPDDDDERPAELRSIGEIDVSFAGPEAANSPDLIVSAEYEPSGDGAAAAASNESGHRLGLRLAESPGSQNSVSYV